MGTLPLNRRQGINCGLIMAQPACPGADLNDDILGERALLGHLGCVAITREMGQCESREKS